MMPGNPLEYLAESQIGIFLLAHVDDTHHHQLSLIAHDAYHTIAHHVGSRVNSKNDLLCIILFQFLILWLKLSVHVRIVRQFLSNAGSIAMTRKHLGFIREHTQMAQAVDDSEHTATREIGTADRTLEEGIAGKRNMLSLAIESDGTVAMTRSLNNLELMAART